MLKGKADPTHNCAGGETRRVVDLVTSCDQVASCYLKALTGNTMLPVSTRGNTMLDHAINLNGENIFESHVVPASQIAEPAVDLLEKIHEGWGRNASHAATHEPSA